jgi:para-nitrobenzyl esterase
LHMASPASKGLFHHAISESGGCTTLQPTLQEGEASAAKLVSLLGCADAADPLTCLRGKSVAELLATSPVDDVTKLFEPVVDGEFLSDQPRALYDKGEIANVPYILGSNTDEGTLFVYQGSYPDEQAYTDALKRLFPVKPEDVAAVYPISPYPNGQPNPQTAALARAIGDADLVCPTLDAAQRAAKAGRSVFIYNFDISTGIAGLGASHGAEIAYVFGTSTRFTDQTRTASDLIQRYWTNFAKTGDPNSGADPTWAPFTASSDTRINFAATGPTQVNNFRATECAFWQRRYQATYDAAK